VISSKSTTPNENTSDLSVSFPLDAYSGAIYLLAMQHAKKGFYTTFRLSVSVSRKCRIQNIIVLGLTACTSLLGVLSIDCEIRIRKRCLPECAHHTRGYMSHGIVGKLSKTEIRNLSSQEIIQ
jgi:hypothetical protein